jgi:membrane-associated phospholipid phosphatase
MSGIVARTACAVAVASVCGVAAANAQPVASNDRTCGGGGSWSQLFTGTIHDFGRLPSRQSARLVGIGGLAALGAHQFDGEVTEGPRTASIRSTFRPGTAVGATPLQLGAAFAAYSIGRASNNGCIASLGADLFRAQLIAQVLTTGIKEATRRSRPEGSGFSFPSGHTTVSFASATVLQQHFGWKIGLPAYAVAGYVGASRIGNNRHYLSDVVFGAALGIAAGRTVAVGPGHRLALSPMAVPGGGGALFTWNDKSARR